MYEIIKSLHMLLAAATGLGLLVRIALIATDSNLLQSKKVTLSYAAIDGMIVLLGIALVIMIPNKEAVLGNGWLSAKIVAWIGLFASVVYGVKIAQQKPIRIAAICIGLLCYLYILAAAPYYSNISANLIHIKFASTFP